MLAFRVDGPGGAVRVLVNLGERPVHPGPGEVLVASGDLTPDGGVPTDTAVWLRD